MIEKYWLTNDYVRYMFVVEHGSVNIYRKVTWKSDKYKETMKWNNITIEEARDIWNGFVRADFKRA